MSGELRVALILQYPSELAFQIDQEKKYIGHCIGKDINEIQTFDDLGTDFKAKIFYEKTSNMEFK